jgi:hypothetical protein
MSIAIDRSPHSPDCARSLSRRRSLGLLLVLGAVPLVGLTGCASLSQITVDVQRFGAWPAGRPAGRYALERLPSQQSRSPAQQRLEAAAQAALERVGFRLTADAASADVLVQLGLREGRMVDPWADFYWGGRLGVWRGPGPVGLRRAPGVGWGGSVGFGWPAQPTYEVREVALLLRDRITREPLIEAHVRHEARVLGDEALPALFDAALAGFPQWTAGEQRVSVPLQPVSAAAASAPASAPASAAPR